MRIRLGDKVCIKLKGKCSFVFVVEFEVFSGSKDDVKEGKMG